MTSLDKLVQDVARARNQFIDGVSGLTLDQASFKPDPAAWSVLDVTEHITIAEDVGVNGIWRAFEAFRNGRPLWSGERIHLGRSIEEVVEMTWQKKEQVPDIAAPRLGGSLSYWISALRSRQAVLETLTTALAETPLEEVVYPHPISGPLDARQRLQFLRFHLDRHRSQIERIKRAEGFLISE